MTDDKTRQPRPLDPMTLAPRIGSGYPEPFRAAAGAREKRAMGDATGLTNYGVNLVHLPPGAWSSQRHWHSHEDEFVYLLEGELALVTDAGERILKAGMCAGFPAGCADGHHLVNRSDRVAIYLEIGSRNADDRVVYSDVDLALKRDGRRYIYTHKDGTPYPEA